MSMVMEMAPRNRPLAEVLGPIAKRPETPLVPASFVSGRAWFVAFASPTEMHWSKDREGRGYFPAERKVEELGFETYVSRESKIIRRNGRKYEKVLPVLGPYVFVRFDRMADEWGAILDLDGIHGLLENQDIPQRVPDVVVERFQRAEAAGAFDFTRPSSAFSEGDSVEIREGPFAGLIAKVRSASPRKRIKLLLDGLGKVDIDASFLSKVG